MSSTHSQSRFKNALIIAAVSTMLLVLIALFFAPSQQHKVTPPDFSSFSNVKHKKEQFFNYFLPLVEQQNKNIEELRTQLISNEALDQDLLQALAKAYRLSISAPATKQDLKNLLKHIDVIPSSLVLSQAAIESAWGTSRFAVQGYNFFGQWCFSKGCGLVPSSRDEDAKHEVRTFDTPKESVQAYFHNINSHPSYAQLRELRQLARTNGNPIHGCELALGLELYSERGFHYINEIRKMIRVNDLSPHGENACKDIPLAVDEPAIDAISQDTTDHHQAVSSKNKMPSESVPTL